MPLKTTPFDPTDHIRDAQDIAWFLEEIDTAAPRERASLLRTAERAAVRWGIDWRRPETPDA